MGSLWIMATKYGDLPMIQLHATRKLFDRLPLNADGQLAVTRRTEWLHEKPALRSNPLSGWHGNLVVLQRRNCVLFVHDATRFPLVLPALTKPDFVELNDRFDDALMNTLLKCGAEEHHLDAAQRYLRPFTVDSQCNRSVLGTLNRMKGDVEHLLWHDNASIAEMTGYRLGAWLADMPWTAKGRGYLHPQKEMLALLEGLSDTLPDAHAKDDVTPDATDNLPDNVVSISTFRNRRSNDSG